MPRCGGRDEKRDAGSERVAEPEVFQAVCCVLRRFEFVVWLTPVDGIVKPRRDEGFGVNLFTAHREVIEREQYVFEVLLVVVAAMGLGPAHEQIVAELLPTFVRSWDRLAVRFQLLGERAPFVLQVLQPSFGSHGVAFVGSHAQPRGSKVVHDVSGTHRFGAELDGVGVA